ncbi:putative Pyrroline-5-carboxylate reductase protein [Naja naja]|nr:putative Pyrroline-5-carboxylate reductase protein [Naja naja]
MEAPLRELRVGFIGAGRMASAVARAMLLAGEVQATFACRTTHCNLEVLEKCSFIFLATKPHILPAVLQEIGPAVTASHVLVSMAAGLLPTGTRVLRMMPNLPCEVRSGAVLLSRGSSVGEEEVSVLKTLLGPCGLCEEAPESYLDIHTASTCLRKPWRKGAAKMMLETGDHPAVLRSAVCTPGGTTIHALHELEKGSLRATVMNAMEAATNRARELGNR